MQGAQKFLAWAFVALTVICAGATCWMMSVLGVDILSVMMLIIFVLAFFWAVSQVKKLNKKA